MNSRFIEAYVNTVTDMYYFTEEDKLNEFLKSDKAKEITDLVYSERMTKEEYQKLHPDSRLECP